MGGINRFLDHRLSIRARIRYGFMLSVLLSLLIALSSLYFVSRVHQHYVVVARQDHQLHKQIHQLHVAFSEENELIRAYLIGQDPLYLEQYSRVLGQFEHSVAAISARELSPDIRRQLQHLVAGHDLFIGETRQYFNLLSHGFPSSALFLWEKKSKTYKADILSVIKTLTATLENEASVHAELARSKERAAFYIAALLASLMIFFSALAGIKVSQSLLIPIDKLLGVTRRISRGDFSVRLPSSGKDELATLMLSVNHMQEGLSRSKSESGARLLASVSQIRQLELVALAGETLMTRLYAANFYPLIVQQYQKLFPGREVAVVLYTDELPDIKAASDLCTRLFDRLTEHAGEYYRQFHCLRAASAAQASSLCEYICDDFLLLPLTENGRLLALVEVYVPDIDQIEEEVDFSTLSALNHQVSLAVATRERFIRDKSQIALKERQQLARDLHDEVSQTLFSVNLMAKTSGKLWHKDPELARRYLDELGALTQSALSEMRAVLSGLRPDLSASYDLPTLLARLVKRIEKRKHFTLSSAITAQPVLPDNVRLTFYRVAQEAFNNIVKHAGATEVNLTLSIKDNLLSLTIKDNGIGFEPGQCHDSSLGLIMMKERASDINAGLSIVSVQNQGSEINLNWQLAMSGKTLLSQSTKEILNA